MKPAYELSASEDEAEEKPEEAQANVPQPSQSLQDSDTFKKLLAEVLTIIRFIYVENLTPKLRNLIVGNSFPG